MPTPLSRIVGSKFHLRLIMMSKSKKSFTCQLRRRRSSTILPSWIPRPRNYSHFIPSCSSLFSLRKMLYTEQARRGRSHLLNRCIDIQENPSRRPSRRCFLLAFLTLPPHVLFYQRLRRLVVHQDCTCLRPLPVVRLRRAS